jgi:hypothetical protein
MNAGIIAGGTIGGISCVAIIFIVLYYLLRRRLGEGHSPHRPHSQLDPEPVTDNYPTPPPLAGNLMTQTDAPQSIPIGEHMNFVRLGFFS